MKYIFWQNMLSLHMAPFINSLSEISDVTLVVTKEIERRRLEEGWTVPKYLENTTIKIDPSKPEIVDILSIAGAIHVFFGINAYPMVYFAFRAAIRMNIKIFIMQEPIQWIGIRGALRVILWLWFRVKYSTKIWGYFNTGTTNSRFINKLCYDKKKLYDWAYFTNIDNSIILNKLSDSVRSLPNLIFIGSIDENKNILNLVNLLLKYLDIFNRLIIIGTGPLEEELLSIVAGIPKMEFMGRVDNDKIMDIIQDSDLLMLPSKWDGWGYVVNEALVSGTPALVSDKSGAACLLDRKIRGDVISDNINRLNRPILNWIARGPVPPGHRAKIKTWSINAISGQVGAKYFISVIDHCLEGNSKKPEVPWLKDD